MRGITMRGITVRHLELYTLVLLGALSVPAALSAAVTAWDVDTAHSTVEFQVRHFFTQVPGRFNDFSGTIQYDPDQVASSKVEFTVQAGSIDTNNDRRDGHLRSEDFFHVEKFPTLSFKSTAVEGSGSDLQVTGDLTIHGVTKSVTIPVEFLGSMDTQRGAKAGFATEFTIDRKDYGVTWNQALDQGGAVLGDEVTIEINVEANEQQMEEEKAAE